MRAKLIIPFFIIILSSCSSSRQVAELQNQIEELERSLIDEYHQNSNFIIPYFALRTDGIDEIGCKSLDFWIKKEESYKKYDRTITFDSLKTKYNRLVDDYNKLLLIDNAKADSIISRRSEIVKKSFDDYRKTRKK
jgi:hypothetical protein